MRKFLPLLFLLMYTNVFTKAKTRLPGSNKVSSTIASNATIALHNITGSARTTSSSIVRFAPTTYNFENIGNDGTTFSSSSKAFKLTNTFRGQVLTSYGSGTPPSNGYADTGVGTTRSGNVGGVQTVNGETFRLVSLDVWPSSSQGGSVDPYGASIQIIGKKGGVQVATGTYASTTFNQTPVAQGGAWHRVTITGTLATTDIDQFEIVLQGSQNYMAIDQFAYDNLGATPVLLSTSPTLTFNSTTGFVNNIAEDGQGGSTPISDINIQTYAINSSGTKLTARPLEYHDGSQPDWNGYPAIITYGSNSMDSFYGWTIKSSDGSNFSLQSLDFLDWGNQDGQTFKIEAFDNGVSKGSLSFVANVGNSNLVGLSQTSGNSDYLLPASFGNVDEVRFYQADGGNSYIAFNDIKVGTPVAVSAPAITGQPSNSTICAGANTAFSATASNATGHQWQVNTGSGFSDLSNTAPYSGVTTATLTITSATTGLNGYIYRVVATGTGTATSNGATLTVNPAPAITAQPSASTICAGANTTFTVTASNATGYQWQVDQGAGFSNISNGAPYSGATTATLTITGATAGLSGYIYRVVATGSCTPSATSNSAALTINAAPAITTQPNASTICAGANTTFSVTTSNATGYQWQVDQGAGFSSISNIAPYSGATTATLTITGATAGLNGYVYRVVATGSCTPSAVSNSAALTINAAPAITTQPNNSVVCPGGNTTFSVGASNATGYQWQVNQGAGFFNIPNIAPYSGASTATLTITGATAGMNGYVYRVVITGTCTPAATSSARTLTITPAPSITTQPGNQSILAGGNASFTATALNATGYQWQVDEGAGFSNISNSAPYSGATTTTLTITGATLAMNGYSYRIIATSSCTIATSSNVTLSVASPAPTVTSVTVPANGTYKMDDPLSFTLNFSNTVVVTGTPSLSLVVGPTTKNASYVSGSGSDALVFTYTIASGDLDNNGITVGAMALNSGTIRNGTDDAVLTLNSVASTANVLVDAVQPTVSSINRVGTTPTNASALDYTVFFSRSVTGVDLADFDIFSAGTANGTITSVSGSGTTYTVTLGNITGLGTLRLDLKSSGTGIVDLVGNPINGGYTSGQVYTVDRIPPAAPQTPDLADADDTGVSNIDNITSKNILTFTGTGAEFNALVRIYVDGIEKGSANANGTGIWMVTSSTLTEGNHAITAKVEDAVGNLGAASGTLNITIDLTPPVAPILITPANGSISYIGAPAISGVAEANSSIDVTVDGSTTGNATTADASGNWTYTLSTALIDGAHTARAKATDKAGNVSMQSNTNTFTVDLVPNINVSGTLTAMSTTYATASASKVFVVSATNLAGSILFTPPTGFELSANNTSFSNTLTIGIAGTLSNTSIYVRLKAGINAASNYNGNIVLSSTGAINKTIAIATSTVNPKPITVTAVAGSKVYGNVDPVKTFTVVPALETGDNTSGVLSRSAGENVGSYTITQGTLSAGDNYIITYNPALFNITQRPITVTAIAKNKTYGDVDPALTYTFSPALISGDSFTGSISRAAGENVGTYTIGQNSLALSNNYTLNYTSANLSITKKSLDIIATSVVKTYNGLAFTGGNAVTYAGFVGSDNAGNSLTGTLSYMGNSQGAVNTGTYTITPAGYASANYQLNYISASLTVNKATLLAKADDRQRCFGQPNPANTVSFTGFVNGETASVLTAMPVITTMANSNSAVGTYVLTVADGSATNYTLQYQNGTLTINPLPVATIVSDRGTSISKGETVVLKAAGGTTYSWKDGNGTISNQSVATIRPSVTNTYTVTVTNASGCSEVKSITIEVREDYQAVEATNILSPNGDGVNDKWEIFNIDQYPNNEVKIFDRGGRVLYGKKAYDNSWDGTLNGVPLDEGTYFYIIDFGPGKLKKKGYITVVRQSK